MPYYITTLILLVVSIFLAIITLAVNGKGKVAFGVGTVAAAISAAISFTTSCGVAQNPEKRRKFKKN